MREGVFFSEDDANIEDEHEDVSKDDGDGGDDGK